MMSKQHYKKRMHWLGEIINANNFHFGAEVGTATGETTQYILRKCPGLECLVVVDDWRNIPNSGRWSHGSLKSVFMRRLKLEMHRIQIREGLSWEMADQIKDGCLDFVFIDASHDYTSVMRDLRAWIPKIKKGGLLCGHDLHFVGVRRALTDFFGNTYGKAGVDNCWHITL